MRRDILGIWAMTALFAACSSSGGNTPNGTGGAPALGGSSTMGGQVTGGTMATSGGQAGNVSAGGGAGGVASTTGGTVGSGGAATTGGVATAGAATTGGVATAGAATTGGVATAGAATTGGAGGAGGTATTGGSGGAGGGSTHWVATWTGSPYYDSGNQPPSSLANSVLRQVVHLSLGGSQLRVQFSNLGGNGSVTIKSAHLALCKAAPLVDSTIDTTTDKALAFSGMASVTIAQGMEVWSDPIAFNVPALGNVTITTAFGSVPSNVVGHSGSRTTSYLQSGSSDVSAASMTSATKTDHWYYISGIDVMASASAKSIAAIGDSITDGRGVDVNKNNRWTDVLAARLQANATTANVAILNQGIGATNLLGTAVPAGQARFERDVLAQSGIRYAIVYYGVNDINGGATFAAIKAGYDDMISRAHAKSVLVYGATIPPFGGSNFYTAANESVRLQVNTYVKSGAFDGVIDFDAALTDGGNPPKLQATYAAWSQMDSLHPGPAGYQKMGESIDLMLFTK